MQLESQQTATRDPTRSVEAKNCNLQGAAAKKQTLEANNNLERQEPANPKSAEYLRSEHHLAVLSHRHLDYRLAQNRL